MPRVTKRGTKKIKKSVSLREPKKYTYSKPGPVGRWGRYVGGTLGSAYGPTGQAIGSKIGGLLHYPAKLFGSGDYYTSSGKMAPTPPTFTANPDGSVTIAHREYLKDIITSATPGAFSINDFDINAGDLATFPWLSTICKQTFQQFEFQGLIFEFISSSADALNSTNTALGSVIGAINYDVTDDHYSTKQQMLNSEWSKMTKPSENMVIPVECKRSKTALNGLFYILNQPIAPKNVDLKMYYLGRATIATLGFQGANVNIGSVFVNYKVKLFKPFQTLPASSNHMVRLARSGGFNANVFGDTAKPIIRAGQPVDTSCDTLGTIIAGNKITIKKKYLQVGARFIIKMFWSSAASRTNVHNFMNITGVNVYNDYPFEGKLDDISQIFIPNPVIIANCNDSMWIVMVVVRDNTQDIEITPVTPGQFPVGCDVFEMDITQINGLLYQNIGEIADEF